MKKYFTLIVMFILFGAANAQNARLTGIVTDEKDSTMIGVTVAVKGTSTGTITDTAGRYTLELPTGTHTIEFSYIGYSPRRLVVTVLEAREKKMDVKMSTEGKDLDLVVVTGTKYEKKLSEEVVSMEVLKASVINQSNSTMGEAINKIPGVTMLGKTMSIRGGSGYSDVTSNRVMGLLDDMPIISPENGSIIWDMIPIEELEQVEVIEGSSSALYGSSALNGVLNMRTINPQPEMVNKILLYTGFYDQPNNKTWDWFWHRTTIKKNGAVVDRVVHPLFGGGQFLHAKQYGDFGLVLSGSYQQDAGFRQDDDSKQARLSAKLRYTPHKLSQLTVGLNVNVYQKTMQDFFAVKGLDSLMYVAYSKPAPTLQRTFNIDPYFNYYDKQESRHSLKFRVFNSTYYSQTGDSSVSTEYYYDYTFLHDFKNINFIVTAGTNGFYSLISGKTFGNLVANISNIKDFSTRDVMNFAAFVQLEKKFFRRLTVSGGIRVEYARLSGNTVMNKLPIINEINKAMGGKKDIYSPVTPVSRIGLNYQAAEGTFLRASIGQGFRYPALAEKYVYTIQPPAQVFPNDSLRPENGWSAEIGIKQGVKVNKWMAYFDVSGFMMRYHDMIEFEVYSALPDSFYKYLTGIPFQASNVDNARILGVELSAVANGEMFGMPFNFLAGYTYIDPVNLDYNPNDPNSFYILKYRVQHSAKLDAQTGYKGFVIGVSAIYNSFMKNIDIGTVGALPVVQEFRDTHHKGDFVMDLRAGYNYKGKATFMLICKNITNTEYMQRPALIDAPRTYTFQVGYNF